MRDTQEPDFELVSEPTRQQMCREAVLSEDGSYRYLLIRRWDKHLPGVCFIMLNPSTADANVDDPTIRRCIGFARRWGFGSLRVVNLYAFRATNPAEIKIAPDPIGPLNDDYLLSAAASSHLVIAAWGGFAGKERVAAVCKKLGELKCLGLTQSGEPRHPLYVSGATGCVHYWPTE